MVKNEKERLIMPVIFDLLNMVQKECLVTDRQRGTILKL